jgi:hypothetical protein
MCEPNGTRNVPRVACSRGIDRRSRDGGRAACRRASVTLTPRPTTSRRASARSSEARSPRRPRNATSRMVAGFGRLPAASIDGRVVNDLPQERRLAASRRPNKNNEFAVLDPDQDAVNHLETAQSSCAQWKFDEAIITCRLQLAPSCAAKRRKPRSPPAITPPGFAARFRHEGGARYSR